MDLVYIVIFCINLVGMLVITLVIAALTLIERKFLALNQRRVGPYYVGYRGRLQYIADALKLFIKGVVIYDESNKFWFVAVPSVCGLICYFFWVNSVWCPSVSIVDIEYNLVYATLLSISFSFCIILLGYFSGNKYTRLASIRSSLMVINLELFLGLMILTTVVVTESFCFSVFVEYQKFWWLIFTYFGLAGLLCLLFLLEVGRTPFDLAEAESELVTGYSTEIGGFTFGIFYLGEYFHLFFFSSVMSIIFLGGWEYPNFLNLNYLFEFEAHYTAMLDLFAHRSDFRYVITYYMNSFEELFLNTLCWYIIDVVKHVDSYSKYDFYSYILYLISLFDNFFMEYFFDITDLYNYILRDILLSNNTPYFFIKFVYIIHCIKYDLSWCYFINVFSLKLFIADVTTSFVNISFNMLLQCLVIHDHIAETIWLHFDNLSFWHVDYIFISLTNFLINIFIILLNYIYVTCYDTLICWFNDLYCLLIIFFEPIVNTLIVELLNLFDILSDLLFWLQKFIESSMYPFDCYFYKHTSFFFTFANSVNIFFINMFNEFIYYTLLFITNIYCNVEIFIELSDYFIDNLVDFIIIG